MKKALLILLLVATTPLFAEVQVVDEAPEYLGVAANGQALFRNQFEGRVIILTFWASWCGPCMKELPALNRLASRYGDRLTVLAAYFNESAQDRAFARRHAPGYKLFFISDPGGAVRKRFGVSAIPHMFVIGSDGMVTMSKLGYSDSAVGQIIEEIEQELQ